MTQSWNTRLPCPRKACNKLFPRNKNLNHTSVDQQMDKELTEVQKAQRLAHEQFGKAAARAELYVCMRNKYVSDGKRSIDIMCKVRY